MVLSTHWTGGLFALGSAFCFASASLLFRRLGDSVSPLGLNAAKTVIAVTACALLLGVRGMAGIPIREGLFLALSGLAGITLGDTAYFTALNALGPRRTLLLDTLSPGTTALLAAWILHERLEATAWFGILLTLAGVAWVLRGRSAPGQQVRGSLAVALAWGLCAVGSHAVGVILAKDALLRVPALEASLVRQVAALAALVLWGSLEPGRLAGWIRPFGNWQQLRTLAGASLLGTFAGIWLSMLGLASAPASIAATLNATGPLFILPLTRICDGERITWRAGLGAAVATAGVALLLLHRGG